MTLQDFTALPENNQKKVLVDAQKLDEYLKDSIKYELFKIEDFYVEVKTCFIHRYRKIINCYQRRDIPGKYVAKVKELLKAS